MLFPFPQCSELDTKPARELPLCQAQPIAHRLDINAGGDVYPVSRRVCLALGDGVCFASGLNQALAEGGHVRILFTFACTLAR